MVVTVGLMAFYAYFDKDWLSIATGNTYYSLPLLLIACGLFIHWLSKPKMNLPPGPMGFPLVGNFFFLGKQPFRMLDKMKEKYGNIMSLSFGRSNLIVLADYQAVEEAYSNPGSLARPPGLFDFLPDGFGPASVNGQEWVEQRRFFLRAMKDLGLGGNAWASLLEDEVSDFIKEIASKDGQPFDIFELLTSSTADNISSFAFGRRFPPGPERDVLSTGLKTVIPFFEQSLLWNSYPWICKILAKLRIGSYHKVYNDMMSFNAVMRKEAEEHKKFDKGNRATDFISQYIEVMDEKQNKGKRTSFTEKNLYGSTQTLFVGGSDTSNSCLKWLFLAMAAFPEQQKKVQVELDSFAEKEQMALWEDRMKFPYSYAAVMEVMRWRTIVPMSVSRMASENMKIRGYDVPKGSRIMANLWGLHNDTRYWKEPEKFIPERFLLNGEKEVNMKPESFLPFSYGKRKCPGETAALMEIFIYFTSTMRMFEVQVPDGGQLKLDANPGLTSHPLPQELQFIPRVQISQNL